MRSIDDGFSLYSHLYQIEEQYNVKVTLKDFAGFMLEDFELKKAIYPFMFHNSPYCMFIKSFGQLYSRCLASLTEAKSTLEKNPKPYLSRCFAGIVEYIMPITHASRLIAYLSVGNFRQSARGLQSTLADVIPDWNLNREAAMAHYRSSTCASMPDLSVFHRSHADISAFLIERYRGCMLREEEGPLPPNEQGGSPHLKALEYIKANIASPLTLEDVAHHCCCSASNLSHSFKKNMGMNIKSYINNLRVKQAITWLQRSNASVTEIALSLGFSDASYFSKVFTEITGHSPTEYRNALRAGATALPLLMP